MGIKDYIKTNWINDKTKLNADNLNHIEDGIENATNEIKNLDNKIIQLEEFAGIKKITLNGIEGSLDQDIWENLQLKPESYSFYLTREDLMLSYAKNNTDGINIQFAYTYNDVEYLKEYYLVVINGNWHLEIIENTLPNKVDKIEGKGLSTNDFTDQYKYELDTLPSKLDKDLVTNIDTEVSGDNININIKYVNLNNNNEQNITKTLPPVTDITPGLMTSEDLNALNTLKSKVENLEGKTTRLLYTKSTNPTKEEINNFVIGLGYTSPFEGIAVVIEQTYHIWHYYSNDNIGWKDDGQDTVSAFTNDIAGIIKGSRETEGKVYAESDGTGSVYGWDALTTKINNHIDNTNNPHNVTKAQIGIDSKQLVTEVTKLGNPTKDDPYIVIKDEEAYRRNSIIDPSTPILYVPPEAGYHVYYIVKTENESLFYIIWSKTDNFTTYGYNMWQTGAYADARIEGRIAANSYYTTATSVSEAIEKIISSKTDYTKGSSTFTMASDYRQSGGYPKAYATISNPFIRASITSKSYTSSSVAKGDITGNTSSSSSSTQTNIPQIEGYFSDEVPINSYKKLADNENLESHINNKSNPHEVTKTQIGLDKVENKALDNKVTENSTNYIQSGAVFDAINNGDLVHDTRKIAGHDLKTDITAEQIYNALELGTAAKKNIGNSANQLPIIGSNGKLPLSIIPEIPEVVDSKQLVTEVTKLVIPTKNDPYIVVKDEEVYRRNALYDYTNPIYPPQNTTDYKYYFIIKISSSYIIVWTKNNNDFYFDCTGSASQYIDSVSQPWSSASLNAKIIFSNSYYSSSYSNIDDAVAGLKGTTTPTYYDGGSSYSFTYESESKSGSGTGYSSANLYASCPVVKSNINSIRYISSASITQSGMGSTSSPSKSYSTATVEAVEGTVISGVNSYKKLATKEEVDNLVGDINTILDKINGETI